MALVFVLGWTQSSALKPTAEIGILPIDPPTPYIHYPSRDGNPGRILVIHGLDASKEVMQPLSSALADAGFEVYSIDLPGHGDSPVPFQTALAEQAIRNAKALLGENISAVGHSLGAALLLDLAAAERFSTLVLLAPPPISIDRIQASRVLIAAGEWDIGRIRNFVTIATDIGEPHVESWLVSRGWHSTPIFDL
jgi:pimeloyl-ACP methyl ester carboxylesterase